MTDSRESASTVNDADCTARAVRAATAASSADRVVAECSPVTASENIGVYAERVPACFAFSGNGTTPGHGGTPLHSHDYRFRDDVLAERTHLR